MEISEFSKLTRQAVAKLLDGRATTGPDTERGNRRVPRWPFPGTVELWVTDGNGDQQLQLATCVNLGLDGLGMLTDDELPLDTTYTVAIHQPEISFQGRATVRHCRQVDNGYFAGLKFEFDEEE